METGIVIAIITGCFAIVLSLIAITERRLDKISARKKLEEETKLETIREESAAHIKKISDEITAQWQGRVSDLESAVLRLQGRITALEAELAAAYVEIKRLTNLPRGTKRQTE
jgi:hypothetical protein